MADSIGKGTKPQFSPYQTRRKEISKDTIENTIDSDCDGRRCLTPTVHFLKFERNIFKTYLMLSTHTISHHMLIFSPGEGVCFWLIPFVFEKVDYCCGTPCTDEFAHKAFSKFRHISVTYEDPTLNELCRWGTEEGKDELDRVFKKVQKHCHSENITHKKYTIIFFHSLRITTEFDLR